jgi:hypothetical protein
MKIGRIFKHTSTYTAMELGEYDVFLGMPFFQYAQCTISFPDEMPEIKAVYKRQPIILPLRTDPSSTVKCFHISRKDFDLDLEPSDEIFQIHYSGWKKVPNLDPEPKDSSPSRVPVDLTVAMARLFKISQDNKSSGKTYDHGLNSTSSVSDTLDQIPCQLGIPKLESFLKEFKSVFPEDLPKNVLVDREIEMKIPL